jgi:hypothetical protein
MTQPPGDQLNRQRVQTLEKLTRRKDDRIRTIRVDQFWRGVVLAPETGDTHSLLRVMQHDKAIEYAAGHQFTVNEALG